MVIPVLITVFPILPCTGKITAGTHKSTQFVTVIKEFCTFGIAVHLASVTVFRLLGKAASVPEPHHGFLGIVRIRL